MPKMHRAQKTLYTESLLIESQESACYGMKTASRGGSLCGAARPFQGRNKALV